MKKYLVIGGWVTSKHDGQQHYVNAVDLCRLYGVAVRDCILASEEDEHSLLGIDVTQYIVLRPRYDGRYKESLPFSESQSVNPTPD